MDKITIILNSMENNIAIEVSEISRTFIFAVRKKIKLENTQY